MIPDSRDRRRRGILLLGAILLTWAAVVPIAGGFIVETPWGTLTSRNALRPFVAGALLLLFYATRWREHARGDLGILARIPLPLVLAAAAIAFATGAGVAYGARMAAGPDASGYVSQSALLARGNLTLPAPSWVVTATWADAERSASPVGYGPSVRRNRLAPTYAPGFPVLLALVQLVGGSGAVFLVVPFLAGTAAWASYRLGAALGGPWAGAVATVLVVTGPEFLAMTVQTMSDVPAAAFWTLALAASVRGHATSAGLATGVAILIRPNLVLLGLVPAAVLLLPPADRVRRVMLFAWAAAPVVAIVAALNAYYRGSPLQSGYGSLEYLYSASRAPANMRQYATWFIQAHTAVPLLGLLAPVLSARLFRLVKREREHGSDSRGREPERERTEGEVLLVTLIFPAAVLAMYLPYLSFEPDEWQYLRFLLPGYPALMAGFGVVLVSFTGRVAWRGREVGAAVAVAALAAHGWNYARVNDVFAQQETDRRYARAVAYVRTLPEDAVLVSLAHSGTLRFYTGRDVLRFDAVNGPDIDRALSHLETGGHPVYLVGDPFEIDLFRERFSGTSAVSRLEQASPTDLAGALVYALFPPE